MFLDPRKSTSIVKEESHSLIEKSNKLFGPKFEEQKTISQNSFENTNVGDSFSIKLATLLKRDSGVTGN